MGRPLIAAVVVAYNPSREILRNIEILMAQVGHVVVVDNTPSTNPQAVIDELEQQGDCIVIRNQKNLGIAAALNIGIRHIIGHGFSWILTFDQDSQVQESYVAAMLSTYAKLSESANIGMVCPRYVDKHLGIEIPMNRNSAGEVVGCWTSGSMIEANTFQSLGAFEEDLFIDCVDYEYCMRMRTNGFKLIECPNAVLTHSLGRITLQSIFGRQVTITNHSPKRRYYITRNRLVLIQRYFRKDREWALTELKGLLMDSIMVLLIEDRKIAKLGYIVRALYDGALNRLGQRVAL